ncbi:hypothetical protein TRVA0_006S03312 [Trichomonascus vanleenenianus]|uniref:uncharacterized protein n=1 Tax=Trichomonascus vanleenenianus TaxID=2268995 RepID=UPI003ECA4DD4
MLRSAIVNIGMSDLILDVPATAEECQFVDQEFSLEQLQDLRYYEENGESVKIDGEYCKIYRYDGTYVVRVNGIIRNLTPVEIAAASLPMNSPLERRKDRLEVLQDLVKTLSGYQFFDYFYGKSTPVQFDKWDGIERFFSLYYCSVILSRDRGLVKKAAAFIQNKYSQNFTADCDDVFTLIKRVNEFITSAPTSDHVNSGEAIAYARPVRSNDYIKADGPADYVRRAADLLVEFMADALPEKMDSNDWNSLRQSRGELLCRIDELSKAHPYLFSEVFAYLHYKGFALLIPGSVPEHVSSVLNKLERGEFCEAGLLPSKTNEDLVEVVARYLPRTEWNIQRSSELHLDLPGPQTNNRMKATQESNRSLAPDQLSTTRESKSSPAPEKLKATEFKSVANRNCPPARRSKAANPIEKEIRKRYVLGTLSRAEIRDARLNGYFKPGGLLDEDSYTFNQARNDILKAQKAGKYRDLPGAEVSFAKRVKTNHGSASNPVSSPEWYRP